VGTESIAAFSRESEAAGAKVTRSSRADLVDVLAQLLNGDDPVVADAGAGDLASELRSRGIPVISEDKRNEVAAVLPAAEAGLCSARAGVAATGTVVIGPGAGFEGFVSLLPPHCVVVLPAERIRPDLAATLSDLAPLLPDGGSRFVFVTGPSRTSDIELTPVVGVHGPLRLDVVIVDA
jgi:L-lactate utilization protein LutC